MKKLIIMLTLLVFPMIVVNAGFCLEEDLDIEFSYGILEEISADQITLVETNIDTDEEEKIVYVINDETVFEGFEEVDELIAGEDLDILYVIRDEKKVADMISIIDPNEEYEYEGEMEEEAEEVWEQEEITYVEE